MNRQENMSAIQLKLPSNPPPDILRIGRIIQRKIAERCGPSARQRGASPVVALSVEPGIGAEGFRIEDGPGGEIRIVGNDARGLLYGAGKFLRTARQEEGVFFPGAWRGVSCPDKPVRGIYFATHFHNYFHAAPIEEVKAYIEDLALWGFNHFLVYFDHYPYRNINDPAARQMLERLRILLNAGRDAGLSGGIVISNNEGYADDPLELRADSATIPNFRPTLLCPSKPEAEKLLLREYAEEFEALADARPDFLTLWPYDGGGCGCAACRPWGSNGYLRLGEKLANLFKHRFPGARIVLSTWVFDHDYPPYKNTGEWEGLSRAFAKRPDWVDYVLADSNGSIFPRHPLERGVPGGLPLVNFPEISMWGMHPWGGFGANPLPRRFQCLWNKVKNVVQGGFPYMEGIFADINMALCSQFYWSKDRSAADTLREYAAFEFSPDVVDDVVKAVDILERNHAHVWLYDGKARAVRAAPIKRSGTEEAVSLLEGAERRLPERVRQSWRWRILRLRALLDHELTVHGERATDRCEEAFDELTRLYHAENADYGVHPPSRKNLATTTGQENILLN